MSRCCTFVPDFPSTRPHQEDALAHPRGCTLSVPSFVRPQWPLAALRDGASWVILQQHRCSPQAGWIVRIHLLQRVGHNMPLPTILVAASSVTGVAAPSALRRRQ